MRLLQTIPRAIAVSALLVAAGTVLPAQAQTTGEHPLPIPAVLQVPTTYSAAAARRTSATGGLANDSRQIARGEFFVDTSAGSRSAELDKVARQRYQQAMALNAARGRGESITFKKAKY